VIGVDAFLIHESARVVAVEAGSDVKVLFEMVSHFLVTMRERGIEPDALMDRLRMRHLKDRDVDMDPLS
jgi:hypothetical protein